MKNPSSPLYLTVFAAILDISGAAHQCNYGRTLFDIGLEKVLGMASFRDFPLEDIRRTYTKVFDYRLHLYQGKLNGLSNLKRWDRSYINATDSGITAHLNIEGGPLEVTYIGTVNSVLIDANVKVSLYIPRIEVFMYIEEPSPNDLTLAELWFWVAPVKFSAEELDKNRFWFKILHVLAESPIEKAVRDKMGQMVVEVVHQFLGKLELFARNGTRIGEIKKAREDPSFIPVLVFPGSEEIISPSKNPLGPWKDPSKWGIFDYSIKRMVLSLNLEPQVFTDVGDIAFQGWPVHITNVTLHGLSFIRRGGDNYAVADSCGIKAQVHLAMENIRAVAYGTAKGHRLRIDLRVIEVYLVIKVKEVNSTIEIEDYQLTFLAPFEYDVYVFTPILGPLAKIIYRLSGRHSSEVEEKMLKEWLLGYLKHPMATVTEFIKDPAPWMPWNSSIIDAYRRYTAGQGN